MTRRNNSRRNVRNQVSRRRPRRYQRQSRASLPPAKTLMGHVMRTVVQTVWDIAQGALKVRGSGITVAAANPTNVQQICDDGWILAQYWINRFKGLFREVKLHRLDAYFVPYEAVTAPGEYIFTLSDYGENETPTSVPSAVGMPASIIRKNGSPSHLTWYPTEPEDRNWHVIGDGHKYLSFTIREMETAYNIDDEVKNRARTVGIQGKVVIDASASFRGKPSSPTIEDPLRDAPYDSEQFKTYKQQIRCDCKKCLRPVLLRIMSEYNPSPAGNTSPFSIVGEMESVSLNV